MSFSTAGKPYPHTPQPNRDRPAVYPVCGFMGLALMAQLRPTELQFILRIRNYLLVKWVLSIQVTVTLLSHGELLTMYVCLGGD